MTTMAWVDMQTKADPPRAGRWCPPGPPRPSSGPSASRWAGEQTWKMPEILPGQDISFPDFTRKCVNYDNFKIATKRRNPLGNLNQAG